TGNIVAGNYIGTSISGTSALGNSSNGVLISAGSALNRIGTNGDGINDDVERNVISSNVGRGINITDSGTNQNAIAGNYIGVNAAGSAALANQSNGIGVVGGAQLNRIGTDGNNNGFDANERNVVSGNGVAGIFISDSGTNSNVVAGNFIGTDASGTF